MAAVSSGSPATRPLVTNKTRPRGSIDANPWSAIAGSGSSSPSLVTGSPTLLSMPRTVAAYSSRERAACTSGMASRSAASQCPGVASLTPGWKYLMVAHSLPIETSLASSASRPACCPKTTCTHKSASTHVGVATSLIVRKCTTRGRDDPPLAPSRMKASRNRARAGRYKSSGWPENVVERTQGPETSQCRDCLVGSSPPPGQSIFSANGFSRRRHHSRIAGEEAWWSARPPPRST